MNDTFQLTQEYLDQATERELQFSLEQANLALGATLTASEEVLSRSTILTSILLAIITSMVGYMADRFSNDKWDTPVFFSIGITVLYLSYHLFKVQKNLFGIRYNGQGKQPSYILHGWFFDSYPVNEKREKRLLFEMIDYCEISIHLNRANNVKRWGIFNRSLKYCLLMPLFFAGAFVVMEIIYRLLSK